ncbi:hypothetical protein T484DRAFT_1773946 [Baffinella frigidus]|nr:hypothetical protein T484DRAFT_1773946 [Cryptophyta sp. CCMP2293]
MAETETPLGGWAVSHADAGPDGEDDKGGWAAREERQGEVAPEFEPRHETKFRKTDFHPSPFRMVGAGILLKHMFEGGALYWDSEGPAGRPHQRLSPQVTLWLAGFGVAVGMNLLLSLPRFSRRLREHISQHKSVLFTSFLLLLLSLTILHLVAVEHSRALVIFAAPGARAPLLLLITPSPPSGHARFQDLAI